MPNPADIFGLINLSGLDNSDVNGVLTVTINANLSQENLFTV
jgi:Cu-processing system permease protein